MTKEEFEEISKRDCYYCGVAGPNGIDRVDSNKGYEKLNCTPSCKHCNYVKGNLSLIDFKTWKNRFVAFQSKKMNFVCLILLSGLFFGCKPAQQEGKSERIDSPASQPQHFKKTSGEPENFNRDIHVIRTLWNELSALNPLNEDEKEKYTLLLEALRERVEAIESTLSDLPESDQALVKKIRSYLNTSTPSVFKCRV